MITVEELARRAKDAAQVLRTMSGACRADALNRMAGKLLDCKEAVFAAFPELVEKSMALAALNMHKKDGFFQINALKEDTTEIVTSEFWPVGLKVYE